MKKATRSVKGDELVLPSGHTVTFIIEYYAVIIHDNGDLEQVIIPMKGTGRRTSKRWAGLMFSVKVPRKNGTSFTPAIYGQIYNLTTRVEKNDKGSWYVWDVDYKGVVTNADVYASTRAFYELVQAGVVRNSSDSDTEETQEAVVVEPGVNTNSY